MTQEAWQHKLELQRIRRSTEAGKLKSKEYARRSYLKNRDKILARAKASYGEINRARSRAHYQSMTSDEKMALTARRAPYMKAYARKNAEKILASNAKWRALNPEKMKRFRDDWVSRNPKRMAEARKSWADKNPERLKSSILKWQKRNRHKMCEYRGRRRARIRSATTDSSASDFYAFVRKQESIQCHWCGKVVSGTKAHIDHIIAISKHGNHTSSNLCASCAACNLKKGNKSPEEFMKMIGRL